MCEQRFDFEAGFYWLCNELSSLALVANCDSLSRSVLQGGVVALNAAAREQFALASATTHTDYLAALRGMAPETDLSQIALPLVAPPLNPQGNING